MRNDVTVAVTVDLPERGPLTFAFRADVAAITDPTSMDDIAAALNEEEDAAKRLLEKAPARLHELLHPSTVREVR